MVIELFIDIVPKTVENFIALCRGENEVMMVHAVALPKSTSSLPDKPMRTPILFEARPKQRRHRHHRPRVT